MGELMGLFIVVPLVLFAVWTVLQAGTGVKKAGKTFKAIDKWADKQLRD